MEPVDVVPRIIELFGKEGYDFQTRANYIQGDVSKLTKDELVEHLHHAGIIPECFAHDSTEEKLYAKYCDALLARSLCELGIEASPIKDRADAADVLGSVDDYEIVGDAKAFRLSRTAKNQKDFKVEALNQWKRGADYACLVCPIYQYPTTKSQIYSQAIRYNVVLLSYTHLAFLIKYFKGNPAELAKLWGFPSSMTDSKDANQYMYRLRKILIEITGSGYNELRQEGHATFETLRFHAEKQVAYWEEETKRIQDLPHDEATNELIKARKIPDKIKNIKGVAQPKAISSFGL